MFVIVEENDYYTLLYECNRVGSWFKFLVGHSKSVELEKNFLYVWNSCEVLQVLLTYLLYFIDDH